MTASPAAVPAPVPGRLGRWVAGARPRTLPAAVVPVAVGSAAAWWAWRTGAHAGPLAGSAGTVHAPVWWRAVAALVVALAIQVGTNYANDYADGIRGTDAARVGPLRLVAAGLARPAAVRGAALAAFAVAGAVGLVLAAACGWWLLAVGAACLLAGWLYTGGPRPYGYLGLGELFVLVFFGLVATVGTTYVVAGAVPGGLWPAAVAVGLWATALLEANNLRDLAGDAVAGKRTLAVRLGRRRAGWLYAGSLLASAGALAVAAAAEPWVAVGLAAAPLAVGPARTATGPAEGRALLPVLAATGRLQLAGGALVAVGYLVGGALR